MALLLFCSYSALVHAGFIVGETRVVYQEGSRSKSLLVGNIGDSATAIQVWVDSGSEGPHASNAPFVMSPPVVLLKRGEQRVLNIIHNGSQLPTDRETLYWINLLEVPPVPAAQERDRRLNVAVNLQLKLFYRPASLRYDLDAILDKVTFQLRQTGNRSFIAMENRSAFVVSITQMDCLLGDGSEASIAETDMTVGPFSGRRFLLSSRPVPVITQVKARVLTDSGNTIVRNFEIR